MHNLTNKEERYRTLSRSHVQGRLTELHLAPALIKAAGNH